MGYPMWTWGTSRECAVCRAGCPKGQPRGKDNAWRSHPSRRSLLPLTLQNPKPGSSSVYRIHLGLFSYTCHVASTKSTPDCMGEEMSDQKNEPDRNQNIVSCFKVHDPCFWATRASSSSSCAEQWRLNTCRLRLSNTHSPTYTTKGRGDAAVSCPDALSGQRYCCPSSCRECGC